MYRKESFYMLHIYASLKTTLLVALLSTKSTYQRVSLNHLKPAFFNELKHGQIKQQIRWDKIIYLIDFGPILRLLKRSRIFFKFSLLKPPISCYIHTKSHKTMWLVTEKKILAHRCTVNIGQREFPRKIYCKWWVTNKTFM